MTRLPGDPHLIAGECPGPGRIWRRRAGGGGNERMPVPSGRLEDLIEGSAGHRSSWPWPWPWPWPVPEEVTIGWRGA
jgi:hypothetical protein